MGLICHFCPTGGTILEWNMEVYPISNSYGTLEGTLVIDAAEHLV